MANTLLSAQTIARKSAMILHQKLTMIGNSNRQYDSTYSMSGANRGDTAKIRIPAQYTSGDGAVITPQATVQQSVSLTLGHQSHVGLDFTSKDLSLSIDDFSMQIIEPAVSVLAANIEATFATEMYRQTYNLVGTPGTVPATLLTYLQANQRLSEYLAPRSMRCMHLSPTANTVIVDALKGLFQDSSKIADQYKDGIMGRASGFDWYENTLVPTHTNGTDVTGLTVSVAPTEAGNTLVIAGTAAADTFKAGTVFTIAAVNRVHPETKVTSGVLQQYVITADVVSAGATVSVTVSPSFFSSTSGGRQNITALPAAAAVITPVGAASTSFVQNIAHHRDAYVFATADLIIPKGTDMAARTTQDGIAMRMIRDYDSINDRMISRLDVLWGGAAVRPELACRVTQ